MGALKGFDYTSRLISKEETVSNPIRKALVAGVVGALFAAAPALAQQKVKIGFITTLSGPQGVIGNDMRNSVELALDHLGR